MRRFGTILAAFLLIVILVIVEIVIIRNASGYEPVAKVVFAKVKIPEKSEVTEDMLDVREIDIGLAHRLSFGNIRDVAGKRAAIEIEAGEMILSVKLGYEGMESIEVKDKSKRLYSVEFKGDQANGWWLMTDQKVDILFIPDKDMDTGDGSGSGGGDSRSGSGSGGGGGTVPDLGILKLQSIRIAALIDENGKLLNNKDRTNLPRYVSFEVTERQADFLAFAKSNGRLELSVIPD